MREYIGYGTGLHSVWKTHTLVLGRPCGRYVELLVRIPTLVEEVIVIAHNANAYTLHIILNRTILLKWQVELIINGMKIMCMREGHLVFLDSVSFLPFALRELPEAFELTVAKSWYRIMSIRERISTM